MVLLDSNTVLVFTLLLSFCCAAPAQRLNPRKDRTTQATSTFTEFLTVTPSATPQVASSPASLSRSTSSLSPSASPISAASISATSEAPKATAASQPQSQAQGQAPMLLSQATAEEAGGGVPSGPPPATSFSPNALALFQVANFIENIESGFFAGVINSLNNDATFNKDSGDGKSIANITKQIAAQELVHKATLGGLLQVAMKPSVPECADIFPINNVTEYLSRANVVTSAAIGVIITIIAAISQTDSPNLLTPLASILSVESQQDTFFRMTGSNTPSASPFNTALSSTFAYNIALTFVDPRSCPQLLPLPILPSMNVTSPVMNATAPPTPPTSITFTASGVPQDGVLFVGWVNQANPVVYTNVTLTNGVGTAAVPTGLSGIAFAALSNQNTATSVDGLTNATLAGPAPILMS